MMFNKVTLKLLQDNQTIGTVFSLVAGKINNGLDFGLNEAFGFVRMFDDNQKFGMLFDSDFVHTYNIDRYGTRYPTGNGGESVYLVVCWQRQFRYVPPNVLSELIATRTEEIEAQQGRALSRAEKAIVKTDCYNELLEQAFIQKEDVFICMRLDDVSSNNINCFAFIGTTNNALITKIQTDLNLRNVNTVHNPRIKFSQFIGNGQFPTGMRLLKKMTLFKNNKYIVYTGKNEDLATTLNNELALGAVLYSLVIVENTGDDKVFTIRANDIAILGYRYFLPIDRTSNRMDLLAQSIEIQITDYLSLYEDLIPNHLGGFAPQ